MNKARLGDLTEPVSTWLPSSKSEDFFNYIDLSAVDNEAKYIRAATSVLGSEAPSRARQIVCSGDVLVSTVRPNLNAVAVVDHQLSGATASTGFTVLRPTRHLLDSRYLFHWVRTPVFIESMVRQATGASYPAVSDRIVKNSLIPVPALPDQRRIAAILDQADSLRAKRRRVLAHVDALTQSIFNDMFGSVRDRSWRSVPLRSVIPVIENGTSRKCEARPANDGEWGILKLGAVTTGTFRAHENKAYLLDVADMASNEVNPGDVLMTRKNTRELVGAVAVVGDVRPRLLLPDLIFRLELDRARINPQYFHALMMNPIKRQEVQALAGGSAGSMPNISKARLNQLPLELPPIPLQGRFASRVRRVNSHREAVERSAVFLDELFNSLQSRAFRGEL